VTPGFLPSALRASLRLFKIFPEDFVPRCEAVTSARTLALGANTLYCAGHRNRVRLSLGGGTSAESLLIRSIGEKKIWV
jgi:hypothetical protein